MNGKPHSFRSKFSHQCNVVSPTAYYREGPGSPSEVIQHISFKFSPLCQTAAASFLADTTIPWAGLPSPRDSGAERSKPANTWRRPRPSVCPTRCAHFPGTDWIDMGRISLMCINMVSPWHSKMASQTTGEVLSFFQIKKEISVVPRHPLLSLLLVCEVALFVIISHSKVRCGSHWTRSLFFSVLPLTFHGVWC